MTKEQIVEDLEKGKEIEIEPVNKGYVFRLVRSESEGGYKYIAGRRVALTKPPFSTIEWLFHSLPFPTPDDLLRELDKSSGEWELPND